MELNKKDINLSNLESKIQITNFRDLGGYKNSDGLYVKYGCFYRGAVITFRTDDERQAFKQLHIKNILDLRSPQEVDAHPDEVLDGCHYVHCSAISIDGLHEGNFDFAELIQKGDFRQLSSYVAEIYKDLPFNNKAYKIMFDMMLNNETPFVFHCSAGKDRTGFAAYLILKTLDVPDETILHDYMLSNVYRENENKKLLKDIADVEGAEGLFYVKESYLQSSMHAIKQKYGDFKTYLKAEYDIDEEKIQILKERYLCN